MSCDWRSKHPPRMKIQNMGSYSLSAHSMSDTFASRSNPQPNARVQFALLCEYPSKSEESNIDISKELNFPCLANYKNSKYVWQFSIKIFNSTRYWGGKRDLKEANLSKSKSQDVDVELDFVASHSKSPSNNFPSTEPCEAFQSKQSSNSEFFNFRLLPVLPYLLDLLKFFPECLVTSRNTAPTR